MIPPRAVFSPNWGKRKRRKSSGGSAISSSTWPASTFCAIREICVYDNYPGGTGLSEGLLQKVAPVLSGCLEVVSGCPCREGCPACIGPLDEDSSSVFNAKDAVVRFLEDLISHG